MKVARACKQCRDSKRKCSFDAENPPTICTPCRKRKILCSKSSELASRTSRALAPSVTVSGGLKHGNDGELSLTYEEVRNFMTLYLRFVHDRPHSLFHESSLWHDLDTGALDQCLILAICAIGCRFATDPRHRSLHTSLGSRSSALLLHQLEQLSMSNVQTCILLANFYAAQRENNLEAFYFGVANRTAYILRLHETNINDALVLRETKCRIWWSLFMADRWCPPALGLPREVIKSDHNVDLPMDEVAYQKLDTSALELDDTRRDGLWKHMISLVEILGPIQDLNVSLLSATIELAHVNEQVGFLAQKLESWLEKLPMDRRMDDTNLDLHRTFGQGGVFVALHLGYHHYSTLLFFQYLDASLAADAQTAYFAERCRFHALMFSKLLYQARSKDNCHVVYLTVAHMTMVSSSVLLHMLLFGDEAAVEIARTNLVYNFEALMELRKYWPHVEHVIERLMTFQNACLLQPNTHRVDRWMVRFLLEHALPFENKAPRNVFPTEASPLEQSSIVCDSLASRNDRLNELFMDWHEQDARDDLNEQ